MATGIAWGFVAAVIKELSSHTNEGFDVFTTWSPYVLVGVGAASMLLSTHAFQAGPLAASQPGFTIVDPLVASLLGVFIFEEHLQTFTVRRPRRGRRARRPGRRGRCHQPEPARQGQTHADEAGLRPVPHRTRRPRPLGLTPRLPGAARTPLHGATGTRTEPSSGYRDERVGHAPSRVP